MLKAKDIMTQAVVTISGSATVAEAVKLMKENKLRALIVERRTVDDPYGIVTETDVIYKVAAYGKDPKAIRVFEIMTKPCITIAPDLGVEYVARLFANIGIRRAPVIEKELLGVVSVSDLLAKSNLFEKPQRLFIEDELEAARVDARAICDDKGDSSRECAAAWDVVEELLAETSDRRTQAQLEKAEQTAEGMKAYCLANPDAPECRLYDD